MPVRPWVAACWLRVSTARAAVQEFCRIPAVGGTAVAEAGALGGPFDGSYDATIEFIDAEWLPDSPAGGSASSGVRLCPVARASHGGSGGRADSLHIDAEMPRVLPLKVQKVIEPGVPGSVLLPSSSGPGPLRGSSPSLAPWGPFPRRSGARTPGGSFLSLCPPPLLASPARI